MIYVDGVQFPAEESSSQGIETLISMMEHPGLKSASSSFNSIRERRFSATDVSGSAESKKLVYIFQREYATVDPSLVDVHLIGGFDDSSSHQVNGATKRRRNEGYSFPLCAKIIEVLEKSHMKFHFLTLHVLGNNTKFDPDGNALPVCSGILLETSTGSVVPAVFDESSRSPDEIVRRIRVTASYEDQSWNGRLLDTYNTKSDEFIIAPCTWTIRQVSIAMMLRNRSDTEILLTCSTSPSAENHDFVENEKRKWNYLIQHPDWRETFPGKRPRVFKRNAAGTWAKVTDNDDDDDDTDNLISQSTDLI